MSRHTTTKPSRQAKPAAQRMREYRARRRAAGLKLQRRWVGTDQNVAPQRVYSDHSLHDARSLAMHCVIARKIAAQPALLQVAKRNLRKWIQRASDRPGYIDEWQQLLRRPLGEVLAVMTSFAEDAVRLRQSSPFAGVLSQQERKRIFDAFRA